MNNCAASLLVRKDALAIHRANYIDLADNMIYLVFRTRMHNFAWPSERSPLPIRQSLHQSVVSRLPTDHTSLK